MKPPLYIDLFVGDDQSEDCEKTFQRLRQQGDYWRARLDKEGPAVFEDDEKFRNLLLLTHPDEDHLDSFIESKKVLYKSNKLVRLWIEDEELMEDAQPERAVISAEALQHEELSTPVLDDLRHLLQTHFPVLYAQVLEPTLADLRLEYCATLAEGYPWKARWVLLQGYGALAAAAACQFGFSLLGRITALWQARSPK